MGFGKQIAGVGAVALAMTLAGTGIAVHGQSTTTATPSQQSSAKASAAPAITAVMPRQVRARCGIIATVVPVSVATAARRPREMVLASVFATFGPGISVSKNCAGDEGGVKGQRHPGVTTPFPR